MTESGMRCAIVDQNGLVLACIMADSTKDKVPEGYPKGCLLVHSEDAGEGDTIINGVTQPKPFTKQEMANMQAKGMSQSDIAAVGTVLNKTVTASQSA